MTSEHGSAAMERIVAGLEHVTRGPWVIGVFRSSPKILHVNGPSDIVVGDDGICQPDRMNDRTFFEDNANMAHIARCDPDSMRSIATYIETLTRERDEVLAVHAGSKSAIEVAYERRLKRYRSGCACHVNDEDELAGICGLHQQLVEDTRNSALEEAAKVAEQCGEHLRRAENGLERVPGNLSVAAAIRALAGGKQE